MGKLKLLWAASIKNFESDGYGYSLHAQNMEAALKRAGVDICIDPQEDCDIAVHIVPSQVYKPVQGKRNLLFSMTETTTLHPDSRIKPEFQPDIFVVPCVESQIIL